MCNNMKKTDLQTECRRASHGCTAAQLLEVKNLSISFKQYDGTFERRGLNTIKNLNLSINGGEIVAVVGASGSGKSLLAHAILGILPYNASLKGDIRYMGEELTQERTEELRGSEIVLVPQSVAYLDPLMKTGKQLALGRSMKKVSEEAGGGKGTAFSGGKSERRTANEKIKEIFARYNLPENVAGLYPFELSGGMARRVLISSAVMEKPKLVIADEPTPGLNIEVAKQVMSHFREMADGGAGVLLITHDLELALESADRIVVFYDGETIDEVRPEAFKKLAGGDEALMHPYTMALWNAMPKNGFEPVYDIEKLVKEVTNET